MAAQANGPRYGPWLAEFLRLLGGPEDLLDRFAKRLDAKMAQGEQEYGDGSFSTPVIDLLGETQAEVLDLAGWGVLAFARLEVLKRRLQLLGPRDFQGEYIFVSGPYSMGGTAPREEREANALQAEAAGRAVLKKGHWPFVPHTMFGPGWETHPGLGYEAVIQSCLAWVTVCDSILVLGGGPGAEREQRRAATLGLRLYSSIDEVPTVPLWDGAWEGVVDHAEGEDSPTPHGGTA